MKKMFHQENFNLAVEQYVTNGCIITSNLDETIAMRTVYANFLHWTHKHGIDAEGVTIQQFGRALRKIEHKFNIQLVRGRSGKPRRWVECFIVPRNFRVLGGA